jgi:hypothetical protein
MRERQPIPIDYLRRADKPVDDNAGGWIVVDLSTMEAIATSEESSSYCRLTAKITPPISYRFLKCARG